MKRINFFIPFFSLLLALSLHAGPLEDAKALEAKGSFSEAMEKYRAWLKDNPTQENYIEILFHAVTLSPSPKEAVKLLKQALDIVTIKTKRSQISEKLGSFLEMLGDFENAQKYYELAYKTNPFEVSLPFLFKSSQLLFELGESQTSEDQIRVVANLSQQPELKKRSIFHLARIMAATGREDEALKISKLITADASFPLGNEAILFFVVELARNLGNKIEETSALERLKKEYPGTAEYKLAQTNEIGSPVLFPSPSILLNPLSYRKRTEKIEEPVVLKSSEVKPAKELIQKDKKSETPVPESIQTGSFSVKENADYMVKDLKQLGFIDTAVREDIRPGGKKIFKVVVPLKPDQKSPEGVQKALLLLKEKGIEGFLLFQ